MGTYHRRCSATPNTRRGRSDAEKLRASRKALGLTQVELGQRVGADATAAYGWEKRLTGRSVAAGPPRALLIPLRRR